VTEYLRGFLKNIMATALCACLLGSAYSGVGVCQTPGYGEKLDRWAPYTSGIYFDQIQGIVKTYLFDGSKITHLHFEENFARVGPVELFRIPVARSRDCSDNDCYFFVLLAHDHRDAPLLTPCQLTQAVLSHLFNPDGSRYFGFEFSCEDTLLRVKVTSTHLMTVSVKKDAAKMEK
jgi:hypothetical protein